LGDPILKKPITKKRANGGAQGEGPEFKPEYHTQKSIFKYFFKRKKFIRKIRDILTYYCLKKLTFIIGEMNNLLNVKR
jgi:hypothetical protein